MSEYCLMAGEQGTQLPTVTSGHTLTRSLRALLRIGGRWRPGRRRVTALAGGLAAGLATYASIIAGMSAPSGVPPSAAQLLWTALAALVTGTLAFLQMARENQPENKSEIAAEHPVMSRMLPPPIPDFTDRTLAISKLRGLLRSRSAMPVVTAISGRPGVGKTSLALYVAHQLTKEYRNGQLYVNLRSTEPELSTPTAVLADFLRALGVAGAAIPKDEASRGQLYRERLAGKRMLIVLDNAQDARQVRPLLPGTSSCGVLITSRVRMTSLEGVNVVNLDVLEPDQARALLTRVIGQERVENEHDAADEIVRQCGALPLAVRIAAAKLAARPDWRLSYLAERLRDERGRLVELNAGDLAVRTVFDIAYRELGEHEQRLLRRLGLLRAHDFPGWVAAALMDQRVPDTERLLDRLVDAQLLDASAGMDGCPRYSFHDLLRLFARENAELEEPPAELTAVTGRMLGAYLCLCERAGRALEGRSARSGPWDVAQRWDPGPQTLLASDPTAWLTQELDGIIRAIEDAAPSGHPAAAWEIADTLPSFLESQARWDDWAIVTREALGAARSEGARYAEGVTLIQAIREKADQGEWSSAQERTDHALEIFAELDDPVGAAYTLRMATYVYLFTGKRDLAADHLAQSIPVFAAQGDRHEEAVAWRSLADIERDRGQPDEAADHAARAVRLFTELGEDRWMAVAARSRGEALIDAGLPEEAIALLNEAVTVFERHGDVREAAMARKAVGCAYRVLGRDAEAVTLFGECLAVFERLREHRWAAEVGTELGGVLAATGDYRNAIARYDAAHDVFTEAGENPARARVLADRAAARSALGDTEGARADRAAAIDLYESSGMPENAARLRS